VIGWHACAEHMIDAERLGIAAVLRQVLDAYPDVRVRTIGVDLGIEHERYAAQASVPFDTLTQELAEFDLGIGPLADTPFSRARSNVKVREYAAAGAMAGLRHRPVPRSRSSAGRPARRRRRVAHRDRHGDQQRTRAAHAARASSRLGHRRDDRLDGAHLGRGVPRRDRRPSGSVRGAGLASHGPTPARSRLARAIVSRKARSHAAPDLPIVCVEAQPRPSHASSARRRGSVTRRSIASSQPSAPVWRRRLTVAVTC